MQTRIISGRLALGLAIGGILGVTSGCDDSRAAEEVLGVATATSQDSADLTGTWELNLEESDRPLEEFRRRHGGGPPGGGDGPAWRRPDLRPGGPGERSGPGGPGRTLLIRQTEDAVEFSGPRARSITLYTDGRTMTHEGPRGEVRVRAHWEGDALIVEQIVEGGPVGTRTYELSEDGNRLIVTIQIEAPRLSKTLEFRRIYDRVTEE